MDNSNKPIISREEAAERGLLRYFTGVLCSRGHLSERYTSTTGCVACLLRKVPKKPKEPGFAFLPSAALSFGAADGAVPTAAEAAAAFRYIEAAGWHLEALKRLRADPALMAKFDHEPTFAERFE
jgi:hypothetical protein